MKPGVVALIACIAILLLVAFVLIYQQYTLVRRPHVKDIWVINLDKDKERWNQITKHTSHIQDIMHRWSATYGNELRREDIHAEGVGFAMTRTGIQKDDNAGVLRNTGVVGCWLSHKRLLQHLAALDVPDYYGHLIVEDDIEIQEDFLKPGDDWHKVYSRIPLDWDMVYLGLTQPIGVPIGERLLRARKANAGEQGNWGTHAYLVRHGSLKTKILPCLEYMTDAIDEQYNVKFDDWNVYVVEPAILKLNETMSANSSLLKMNAGASDDVVMHY